MIEELNELIEILDDVAERIEALAVWAEGHCAVTPDFSRIFGDSPEIRAGRRIGAIRSAQRAVERASITLCDVADEDNGRA